MISREPWISWKDLCKQVKCDKILFNTIKNDLKAYYFAQAGQDTATEQDKNMAVQLQTGKPLGLLSQEEVANVLHFLQKREKIQSCLFGKRKK